MRLSFPSTETSGGVLCTR